MSPHYNLGTNTQFQLFSFELKIKFFEICVSVFVCSRSRAHSDCRRACQRLKCSVRALATAGFFCSLFICCAFPSAVAVFFLFFFLFIFSISASLIFEQKNIFDVASLGCTSGVSVCVTCLSFHFHPSLYMFLILVFSIRFSVFFFSSPLYFPLSLSPSLGALRPKRN